MHSCMQKNGTRLLKTPFYASKLILKNANNFNDAVEIFHEKQLFG